MSAFPGARSSQRRSQPARRNARDVHATTRDIGGLLGGGAALEGCWAVEPRWRGLLGGGAALEGCWAVEPRAKPAPLIRNSLCGHTRNPIAGLTVPVRKNIRIENPLAGAGCMISRLISWRWPRRIRALTSRSSSATLRQTTVSAVTNPQLRLEHPRNHRRRPMKTKPRGNSGLFAFWGLDLNLYRAAYAARSYRRTPGLVA
jgi:hypothetical protein